MRVHVAAASAAAATASLAAELPWWGWVDARTVVTLGGELVTVGEVATWSGTGASAEETDRVTERWMRMFSACPPETRVSVLLLRRPAQLEPELAGPEVAQAAQAKRIEHMASRVEAVRVYVAVSSRAHIETAAAGGNGRAAGWRDHAQRIWSSATAQFRAGGGDDVRSWLRASLAAELSRTRLEADALLAMVADVTPVRVLEAEEASAVLGELVNRPGYQPVGPPSSTYLSWWLARSSIEVERQHMRLDSEPAAVYSLLSPPLDVDATLIAPLGALRGTATVVLEWRPREAAAAKKTIQATQKQYHARTFGMMSHATGSAESGQALGDASALAAVDRLGEALVELETEGLTYGDLALTVTLHGSMASIEQRQSDLHRIFATSDAKIIRESFGMASAYFGRLPGQPRNRQQRTVLASAGVAAALAPIMQPWQGHERCRHLDAPALVMFETTAHTPHHFDLFGGSDVGHTAILGATGSGKSFLANFLLLNALRYNARVCILDLGGSYQGLTQLVGGDYLALSADSGATRVAPFGLPPGDRSVQFLTGWVIRLLRIGGHQVSGEETTEIGRRIEDMWEMEPHDRRIGMLVKSLPSELWPPLERWTADGRWGQIFDNPPDDWQVADWQVVDLAGASEHEDLTEAALMFFLERLRLAVDGADAAARLKILMVDEAWRFLRDEETASWLMEAAKTWRKRNAALVLATQSAGDIVESEAVRRLVESMPTKLFLSNPAFNREHADAFGLGSHEPDIIRSLISKKEVYCRRPTRAEKLRLDVDAESYWLYTSSAREAAERAALAREVGISEAVRRLAQGRRS